MEEHNVVVGDQLDVEALLNDAKLLIAPGFSNEAYNDWLSRKNRFILVVEVLKDTEVLLNESENLIAPEFDEEAYDDWLGRKDQLINRLRELGTVDQQETYHSALCAITQYGGDVCTCDSEVPSTERR